MSEEEELIPSVKSYWLISMMIAFFVFIVFIVFNIEIVQIFFTANIENDLLRVVTVGCVIFCLVYFFCSYILITEKPSHDRSRCSIYRNKKLSHVKRLREDNYITATKKFAR